jgi:alkylation response protein AidB-like acyl-CoA dehydrogenase
MHAPGVEIRPLRQMTGGASFNEVFFNEVRVPDDHRLGDVNEGWRVALTTLMNERASIGAGGAGGGMGLANSTRLVEMLRHFGLDKDPVYRDELMKLHTAYAVAKYTNQRAMDRIKSGELPGPEMSIAKLALTQNMWRTAQFVAQVLGPRITANTGEWGTYSWSGFVLGIPGMRIAGGSDEVMRNVVAERVLGMPKDPGIDSTTPFRDLKVGTQEAERRARPT